MFLKKYCNVSYYQNSITKPRHISIGVTEVIIKLYAHLLVFSTFFDKIIHFNLGTFQGIVK